MSGHESDKISDDTYLTSQPRARTTVTLLHFCASRCLLDVCLSMSIQLEAGRVETSTSSVVVVMVVNEHAPQQRAIGKGGRERARWWEILGDENIYLYSTAT